MNKWQWIAVAVFAVGTILDSWTTAEGIKRYGFKESRGVWVWFHERITVYGSMAVQLAAGVIIALYVPDPTIMIILLWLGGVSQLVAAYHNWTEIQKVRAGTHVPAGR